MLLTPAEKKFMSKCILRSTNDVNNVVATFLSITWFFTLLCKLDNENFFHKFVQKNKKRWEKTTSWFFYTACEMKSLHILAYLTKHTALQAIDCNVLIKIVCAQNDLSIFAFLWNANIIQQNDLLCNNVLCHVLQRADFCNFLRQSTRDFDAICYLCCIDESYLQLETTRFSSLFFCLVFLPLVFLTTFVLYS